MSNKIFCIKCNRYFVSIVREEGDTKPVFKNYDPNLDTGTLKPLRGICPKCIGEATEHGNLEDFLKDSLKK